MYEQLQEKKGKEVFSGNRITKRNKECSTVMNAIDCKGGLKIENSLTFLISGSLVTFKKTIFN